MTLLFFQRLFQIQTETGTVSLPWIDEQGAIVFEVAPLNRGTPAETLEFNLARKHLWLNVYNLSLRSVYGKNPCY